MRDHKIALGLIAATAAVGCATAAEPEGPPPVATGPVSERISSNDLRDLSPRIAVDTGGVVHVLWTSLDAGDEKHVEYAEKRGGTWTGERLTGVSDTVLSYDFAVDLNGVAHVIWSDEGIKYRHNAGGSFSETEVISTSATSNWDPSIAAAPDGTLHAAWSENAGYLLQHAKHDGQSWAQLQNIDTLGLDSQPLMSVGLDSTPRICWQSVANPDYTGDNVFVASLNNDDWIVEPLSEDHVDQVVDSYDCLIDSGGYYHIAYVTHDAGKSDVYYASNATGAFAPVNVSSSPDTDDHSVHLAIDSTGVAHLVWIKGFRAVYYATVTYGAPDTPVQLSESDQPVLQPRVAAAPDGLVHAVWTEFAEEKQYGWAEFEPNYWVVYWSNEASALQHLGSPGYSLEPDIAAGEEGMIYVAHTTYLEREETDREIFLTGGVP